MKTATSVCAIERLVATNVVGLVEFHGRSSSLFSWIYFTVQLKTDGGKLK